MLIPPPAGKRRAISGHGFAYRSQERALFAQDEALLLCVPAVFGTFSVHLEPRAILLVSGEAVEPDQRQRDVVGAFMRHEITQQVAAASRNDGCPAPGIFLEGGAFEWIEHVTNAAGDRHDGLPGYLGSHADMLLVGMLRRAPKHPAPYRPS